MDRAAPTGAVKINSGAAFTRKRHVTNRDVTLSLAAVDPAPGSGVSNMRFSRNGRPWTH